MLIPISLMIILPLASPFLFVHGQPQGYVLIYSPPRGYQVDWMDVKAVYMKEEGNRLYFYVEYYGAIPSSGDYERWIDIFMDTDRNPSTGFSWELGLDYYILFRLYGDNSFSYATLNKWDSTSSSWKNIKSLKPNARLASGLSYMEIWVDKQDIGYTPNGIDFYIVSDSYVKAIPGAELTYVVGSLVKQITVDGEPGDWGSIAPSVTFPPRSINPPELETSSIYVANDGENLYFRFDTRGKPTTTVSEGKLDRYFSAYLDTDNNGNTGYREYGGAEFYAYAGFSASPSKYTRVDYYRYTGTGRDYSWQEIEGPRNPSDFNNVFEFKIPLSLFELGSGQTVGIIMSSCGFFTRQIPPSGHLTYPPDMTPPTISGASPTGTISSTSVTFSVTVEDAGSGVKEVRLIVDDVSQGLMSVSGNTYTMTVSLSEGSHTWSIEAVDNVGNTATQSYSLTVSTWVGLLPYLTAIAIVIVIIAIVAAAIMLRRRRAPLPPPPPPPP
jgi:hypothetical protein